MNRFFILILFLFISPLIIIAMILVFIEDGRPVLIFQDRVGLDKKVFKLFKIRTMNNSAPLLGTHEVSKSHYLKIGSILRRLKIDELPQIINYLKGELNIIGPRPGMPNQDLLTLNREKQGIFNVKPGISGLSQILGYDMSDPVMLSNIDKLYIDNKSVKLDLKIFIATFVIAQRKLIEKEFKVKINKIKNDKIL
jgi:lipopolysaccharide/colanic/teichoic acid biosynthesis glycosyltransferase